MFGIIHYTLVKIDGDYAHLLKDGESETLLVSRALLPFEADEGTKLIWENLEYRIK